MCTFSLRHAGHVLTTVCVPRLYRCLYPHPPIRTSHSTAALHSQLTYAFFSRSSSETLSCRSRFSVHRSAHLAHERGDASAPPAAPAPRRSARDERHIFEDLSKICLCEQRFALSKFASTQKKILVRAKLRQLAYALASFFRSLSQSHLSRSRTSQYRSVHSSDHCALP